MTQNLPSVHDLPHGERRSRPRSLARLLDRVSMYAPLLMMGVLALGTYWLVRNTPNAPTAHTANTGQLCCDRFRATRKK